MCLAVGRVRFVSVLILEKGSNSSFGSVSIALASSAVGDIGTFVLDPDGGSVLISPSGTPRLPSGES